jgi:ELWxxDGT repeat protein
MKYVLYILGIAFVSACLPEDTQENTTEQAEFSVESLFPEPDASEVSVKTEFVVTLSNALQAANVDGSEVSLTSNVTGKEVTGSWVYDEPNLQLLFTPDFPLAIDTQYSFTLNEDLISDTNETISELDWSFTTTADYGAYHLTVSEACTTHCDYEPWVWDEDGLVYQLANIDEFGSSYASADGVLYKGLYWFSVNTDDEGSELWVSDGTPYFIELFADLIPGTESSSPKQFIVFGDYLYFSADTGDDNEGGSLWRTDGTVEGTVAFFNPRPDSGSPSIQNLSILDEQLIFTSYGYDNENNNVTDALYSTDGTIEGTGFYKDLLTSDSDSAGFDSFFELNGKLYFEGTDGNDTDTNVDHHSYSLFVTDGTDAGTQLVKDINPTENDSSESRINQPVVLNDVAIFEARDGTNGQEIWRTDGTEAGTYMLEDITEGSGHSSIKDIVVYDGSVYFSESSTGLWQTDGTVAGTELVKAFDEIKALEVVDNGLVFFATSGTDVGLWLSDGTDAGTQYNYPTNTLSSVFGAIGKTAFFSYTADTDDYFYITDGTYDGTSLITSPAGLPFIQQAF